MTGGRIRRILPYVQDEPFFGLTYGDGVADLAIDQQIAFHKQHGRLATVMATYPARRFGAMKLAGDSVTSFREKPEAEGGWVNGGFFILSPQVGQYLSADSDIWEGKPLERLAQADQLRAFQHTGFWHPMDTLGDKHMLDEKWRSGNPPWKVWEE
jgi:glucose-1-phosphate cytidylyltransferase